VLDEWEQLQLDKAPSQVLREPWRGRVLGQRGGFGLCKHPLLQCDSWGRFRSPCVSRSMVRCSPSILFTQHASTTDTRAHPAW